MKDLNQIETPESDRIVIEQDIKKTIKFIGSERKIKGLTLFEFNPVAMTLEPAKYKEVKVEVINNAPLLKNQVRIMEVKSVVHNKVIYKDDCVYIQALNKRVAYKKIAKATHTKK